MKVLIVDDNTHVRALLKIHFEKAGFYVFEAGSGFEGLDIANSENPDIIISDVMMQEMDGFKFIQLLRENAKFENIPIIILSAKETDEYFKKAKSLNVNEYIIKPFSYKELAKKAKEMVINNRNL